MRWKLIVLVAIAAAASLLCYGLGFVVGQRSAQRRTNRVQVPLSLLLYHAAEKRDWDKVEQTAESMVIAAAAMNRYLYGDALMNDPRFAKAVDEARQLSAEIERKHPRNIEVKANKGFNEP
jgi:hypothetical protein